jgi:large subunit ribosomal protein L29
MTKLAEELRDCDDDELEVRLENARKELFNLRFQVATGRLDNVSRIGQVRRSVATILTVQRTREIDAAESLEDGAVAAPRVRRARAEGSSSAPSADETASSAEDQSSTGGRLLRRRGRSAAEATGEVGADEELEVDDLVEGDELDGEEAGDVVAEDDEAAADVSGEAGDAAETEAVLAEGSAGSTASTDDVEDAPADASEEDE